MATAATDTTAIVHETRSAGTSLSRLAGPALIAGALVLIAAAALGASSDSRAEFWHAYLMNFAFVASLVIGGLFFTLASHLFGAYWSTSIRRLAEIVAGAMPVIFLLFIPIAVFVLMDQSGALYPWTNRAVVEADPVLKLKAEYLSPTWFVIRAAIIFAVWLVAARIMGKGSLRVDQTGSVETLRGLAKASGPLMVLFAVSLNVASFDWLMSLDPIWFSTMFGVYYWAGGLMAFLALLTLMIHFLQGRGMLTQSIRVEQRHDIAKLMFAMVIFWGYVTFSQFMLIWYANIPEETKWYADRGAPAAMGISSMTAWLFILHLFVPFLGFMSKRVRRNPTAMAFWSVYLLAVHWYDMYYIVMPTLKVTHSMTGIEPGSAAPGLLEGLCLVGMLLVLLGGIARGTADKWLAPYRDPRMHEALTYVNH
jgi:hypothetical protein